VCHAVLLLPESRKQPLTRSLLYRRIMTFFDAEGIVDVFKIAFITINGEIIDAQHSAECYSEHREKSIQYHSAPRPVNFREKQRSGHPYVTKDQIDLMAAGIMTYLQSESPNRTSYIAHRKFFAYCRGSYLEAVHRANASLKSKCPTPSVEEEPATGKRSVLDVVTRKHADPIRSLLTEADLQPLKKRGIMWMKVGLRMPDAFDIFKYRIREIVRENQGGQLHLPM
jgi:hypothetical protein